MIRRRQEPPPENHERWLVSYADFITLLFAFFVVMFATSHTDRGKQGQMEESMKKAIEEGQIVSRIAGILGGVVDDKGRGNAQMRGPGGAEITHPDSNLQNAMRALRDDLAREIKEGKMEVNMEARGLVISFNQTAFFPSGTDEIPDESVPAVAKVADTILKLPNPVRCEGHTDSVPLKGGRFQSNWDLSAARAIAMMELLVDCCDLARARFSIGGYAENAPVADNATEEGRGRNRRVDIVILNADGARLEPRNAAH